MLIGLVSCGKQKRNTPCCAKDMYTGTYFLLSRRYVTTRTLVWGILSAKYGLLNPDDLIAPYDLTLSKVTIGERRCWCDRVKQQIETLFGRPEIIFVGGGLYLEALNTFNVVAPFSGLPIGKQMKAINHALHDHQTLPV